MTSQACCIDDFSMWVFIIGIGLVGVPSAQATEPAASSSDRKPSSVSAPTGPVEPYGILPQHVTIQEKIEKVRRDGKRSGLSPEVIEKIAQDMEKGLREEAARPKPEIEQTGIFPGEAIREQLGAGSSAYYLIENGWFDILNGKETMVYAGSYRRDPANDAIRYDPPTAHGFVIIVKGQPGEAGTTSHQVYTPTAVGSLHVVAAKGTTLTLQSRQGNKFLLNVETEQLTPLGNRELRPR